MAIKTIFFDWGGVIADDPGDDFLRLLLKKIGASNEQVEEIYEATMKQFMKGFITEQEYWDILRKEYGFTIHESISDDFKQWSGLRRNQDIVNFIEEIKTMDIRVALLTNVIEPTYNVLSSAGYYDQFEKVIASCKVGYAKPDKEIYNLSLKEMDATTETSLFIDDKQRNIEPAEAMGFATVLAQDPHQIIRDIRAFL